MTTHPVVSREEWTNVRRSFLEKEKEFTRLRDDLSQQRRQLPWVKVQKDYAFETSTGRQSLAELFDGRSQLIVYHFMFAPSWSEGCPGCSYLMDHIDGAIPHMNARDVTFVAASRAPLAKIEPFKKRMGWGFKWMSSGSSDFNFDFGVSFKPAELEAGTVIYNYREKKSSMEELPGLSAFVKEDGVVYHSYSTYERGLDQLLGAYNYIDLTARGRDEASLPYPMAWVRHHDRYGRPDSEHRVPWEAAKAEAAKAEAAKAEAAKAAAATCPHCEKAGATS